MMDVNSDMTLCDGFVSPIGHNVIESYLPNDIMSWIFIFDMSYDNGLVSPI
jgi:hypothetical protein